MLLIVAYRLDRPETLSLKRIREGLSDDDITHVFKLTGSWELPKLQLQGVPQNF